MLKRAFDFVVSLLIILIALPLWLAVAVAIKLDSSGPVFHRATRIGQGGRPFTLYKFRTMVPDATRWGPGITRDSDPRITGVGRFLRKLKIDEMPQLINVLKGDMSIVGPLCAGVRGCRGAGEISPLLPGSSAPLHKMASPAFNKYRHEEEVLAAAGDGLERVYLTQIMPDKLRMDLEYIEQQSFLSDLAILVQAALSLFQTSPAKEY